MKLDVCDRCKKFNPPGMQVIRTWQLDISMEAETIYPAQISNEDDKNYMICTDCMDLFKSFMNRFWTV